MLGFLKRWWSRDHQRNIFTYYDGSTKRRADPLTLGRRLESLCPEYADHLNVIASDVPAELAKLMAGSPVAANLKAKKEAAFAALVKAADETFGLTPLTDRNGLTEAERLRVLTSFLAFLVEAADLARPFSNSQPRASPSTQPDSPTEPFADSGTGGSMSRPNGAAASATP